MGILSNNKPNLITTTTNNGSNIVTTQSKNIIMLILYPTLESDIDYSGLRYVFASKVTYKNKVYSFEKGFFLNYLGGGIELTK